MIFCLFVEDLGEFSTGDEGLFVAGIVGEHFNSFGQVIIHVKMITLIRIKKYKVGIREIGQ